MSWNFRSRKTRCPSETSSATKAGPSVVNRRLPILKPPTAPRSALTRLRACAAVSTSSATRSGCISSAARLGDLIAGSDRPHKVPDAGDAVPPHVVLNAVEQLRPDKRIHEVGCAHLHRRRSGHDELQSIPRVGDAAHADHRDLYRLVAFVHHA